MAKARGAGALAAGAGIFASRIAGLVRERVFAHYLGTSPAADAYKAATRIPNLLQNLLGEGVLSASFIPVYARLQSEGKVEEARIVARTVATLLALIASAIAVLGVLFAESLVGILAAGFTGETKELTVLLVQILFPGVAVLVLAAWCLGVLNSHRKFFLSYASPVLWNIALIAACVVAGQRFGSGSATSDREIVVWVAWGALIGSIAQFVIQLPAVLRLIGVLRPSLATSHSGVRHVLRSFVPVLLGRGSVQISAYIDGILASYLGAGIVTSLGIANTLYILPISLFGIAISAAELPEMASITGNPKQAHAALRARLQSALRRVVFFVIPSAVAFVAVGNAIIALLFQTGDFDSHSTLMVWIILAGSAIGLAANTQGRILSSALYALGDARSPLYAALVRLVLTLVAGWAAVFPLRSHFGYADVWGAFGLTASAGFAAWVEFEILRRTLASRIGSVPIPHRFSALILAAAALAGGAGYGIHEVLTQLGLATALRAGAAIAGYCAVFLAVTLALRVPELEPVLRRLRRRKK